MTVSTVASQPKSKPFTGRMQIFKATKTARNVLKLTLAIRELSGNTSNAGLEASLEGISGMMSVIKIVQIFSHIKELRDWILNKKCSKLQRSLHIVKGSLGVSMSALSVVQLVDRFSSFISHMSVFSSFLAGLRIARGSVWLTISALALKHINTKITKEKGKQILWQKPITLQFIHEKIERITKKLAVQHTKDLIGDLIAKKTMWEEIERKLQNGEKVDLTDLQAKKIEKHNLKLLHLKKSKTRQGMSMMYQSMLIAFGIAMVVLTALAISSPIYMLTVSVIGLTALAIELSFQYKYRRVKRC